jgi:hypothetical protein
MANPKIIILRNGNKYGHVVFDGINETAKEKLISAVSAIYPDWPIEDQSNCTPVISNAKTDAGFKRALKKKKEKMS